MINESTNLTIFHSAKVCWISQIMSSTVSSYSDGPPCGYLVLNCENLTISNDNLEVTRKLALLMASSRTEPAVAVSSFKVGRLTLNSGMEGCCLSSRMKEKSICSNCQKPFLLFSRRTSSSVYLSASSFAKPKSQASLHAWL